MTIDRNKRSRFPLPDVINPTNRICVTLNIPDNLIHIGNFWGAIQKLAQARSYSDDPVNPSVDVANVWKDVIADARTRWLDNECGGEIEEGDCTAFDNCSGLITWFPQNPCTEPDLIPTGYILPPWFIIDNEAIPIAFGAKKGDAWTDLTRVQNPLSPPDPESGGAHLRFTFQNPVVQDVTVECHFVKVPSFGYALISQDDNPTNPLAELVDLNRDLASVPPETSIEVVIERHFVNCSVGSHHVDIGVLPYLDNEAEIPLHYGMCVRGFVLCGKDLGVPVPEMQFTDCKIRFRPSSSAAWQEFDITDCVKTVIDEEIEQRLEDGELGGSQREPDGTANTGFCKTYHVTLRANQRWVAPIPIGAGYRITVTNARGGASDGTINWYCPQSTLFGLGTCGSVEQAAQVGDPLQSVGHMRLIMSYNSVYYDAYNLVHTVSSSLNGQHQLELQVNDSPIADNSGDYQFDIEICNVGACVPALGVAPQYAEMTFSNGIFTASATAPDPAVNNGYWVYIDLGDDNNNPCECRKVEIISLTGYLAPDAEDNFNAGAFTRCDGTRIPNGAVQGEGINYATFYNALSSTDQCGNILDARSQTPFTIQFRVVDC